MGGQSKAPWPTGEAIVFRKKSRLIGGIEDGKNGYPVGVGREILRAEIQQDRHIVPTEITRVCEIIGLRVKHGLLRMGDGIGGGYKSAINLLLNCRILIAKTKLQSGLPGVVE